MLLQRYSAKTVMLQELLVIQNWYLSGVKRNFIQTLKRIFWYLITFKWDV